MTKNSNQKPNIAIVGCGQLGSRHLQSLKRISYPLEIQVFDPSESNLMIAKERYESFPGISHSISFHNSLIDVNKKIDLAIIATNSDTRYLAFTELIKFSSVTNIIFEKLLFNLRDDYAKALDIVKNNSINAWVNCSMRTMPFYNSLRGFIKGNPVYYNVLAGNLGLVTNSIHYIDHVQFLTGAKDFTLDTSLLRSELIPSKRKGFFELTGSLIVKFSNGSLATITDYHKSNLPCIVQIVSEDFRCISKESEGKVLIQSSKNNYNWDEFEAKIPYQSEMTAVVVDEILNHGDCELVEFERSCKSHVLLLDGLADFINSFTTDHAEYPFT